MKMRFIFAGLAIFALYVGFLGRHGVLQQTEARYAEISREMKVSHDFLIPTLNGIPHIQKPPVTYWLASGSMMIFGENEIGARVAPLMAGFGVLLLVFATLLSQAKGLAPAMGSGVSLKPLAERIRREPNWKQSQVIVAGVRGHGMEFYLKRFVDNTRKQADVTLPLTPDQARRIHPSIQNIRFATNGIPVFVVTTKKKLKKKLFPAPEWTELQRQGKFVLLRRNNGDFTNGRK